MGGRVHATVAAVALALSLLLASATLARADFLTTVHKAMSLKDPTTFPSVAVPAVTEFQAVATESAALEAGAALLDQHQNAKAAPLTEVERSVLRKHFGALVDKVGVVFGAQLSGADVTDGGAAFGTLLFVSGDAQPKPTAQRLRLLGQLLFRGTQEASREAEVAFLNATLDPLVNTACGSSSGVCPWSSDELAADPAPSKAMKPCSGSGNKRVTGAPGMNGRYRGGWECAKNSRQLAPRGVVGPVPHGYGAMRVSTGLWIGRFKWGSPVGSVLFLGNGGERRYGPVDSRGRLHGVVKIPSALGFTRYVEYAAGKELDDAWVTVGKARFKGTWKAGLVHEGELKDASGAHYTGRFCKGQPCGQAKLVTRELTYDGRWRAGKPSGRGAATWAATGHTYSGTWKHGAPKGAGKSWVDDAEGARVWTFDGLYDKGKRNGRGTLTFDDCSFTGTWVDARVSGETTFACKEFQYVGGMMGSTPHGRGSLTDKVDGSRYRGRFHLGTLVHGTARWRTTSGHPLAKFLVEAGNAIFPGYVQRRLYYRGKFRGVKPHGSGSLLLVVQRGSERPIRLVLEGQFDNRAATGVSDVRACKEVQGEDSDDWRRQKCSGPWVVDGNKQTTIPRFP